MLVAHVIRQQQHSVDFGRRLWQECINMLGSGVIPVPVLIGQIGRQFIECQWLGLGLRAPSCRLEDGSCCPLSCGLERQIWWSVPFMPS